MDTTKFTPAQMNTLRRVFHAMNHFMVFMWKIGLGRWINAWPAVGGRMMVIQHRGRRSGKIYLTPVNYASVDGEVYWTNGFFYRGPESHIGGRVPSTARCRSGSGPGTDVSSTNND